MRKYLQGLLGGPHIGQNKKQTELGKGLVMAWRHLTVMRGPAIEGSAAEAAREAPPGGGNIASRTASTQHSRGLTVVRLFHGKDLGKD